MILLAIDPSSTRTGYALMSNAQTILDAGLLKPEKNSDPAIMRIVVMAKDLTDLLYETWPDQVVIEIPSAHTAGRLKFKSAGAGLAIYGLAAGAMFWACNSFTDKTDTVDAELWTRGIPKKRRQQEIATIFQNRYDATKDVGGDIADAIGLACWWFSKQRAKRIAG